MQSVRYINPNGEEAVIKNEPPFIFDSISGNGVGDVQPVTSEPVDLDGEPLEDLYIGPREVTVKFSVYGKTPYDLYANRQKLLALLNPVLNKHGTLGRLEYTNDLGTVWIPASVKKGPSEFTKTRQYFTSLSYVFYCPSPFWRGTTYNRVRLAYLGGGMKFPLQMGAIKFGSRGYQDSLWNLGDSPSALEIDITGPATQPEIVKVKTGEYIRVKRQLEEGDILHIDTTPGSPSVTIQRAIGLIEKAIGYLDLTSDLFQCDPGENVLQFISGDDGQTCMVTAATLPWYGGW